MNFLNQLKFTTKEILKLSQMNLINSAAHITGGGLVENLLRAVPDNYSIIIDYRK